MKTVPFLIQGRQAGKAAFGVAFAGTNSSQLLAVTEANPGRTFDAMTSGGRDDAPPVSLIESSQLAAVLDMGVEVGQARPNRARQLTLRATAAGTVTRFGWLGFMGLWDFDLRNGRMGRGPKKLSRDAAAGPAVASIESLMRAHSRARNVFSLI